MLPKEILFQTLRHETAGQTAWVPFAASTRASCWATTPPRF